MEAEFKSFIKVWILAITSICYCYYISARFPKGLPRLLSILPVISLFFVLPFSLSTVHFCGITAFFLSWLANFKLLLFSFNQGPLSPPPPQLSHFISIACLPIKLKQDSPLTTEKALNSKNGKTPFFQNTQSAQKELPDSKSSSPNRVLLVIKVVLLALVFHLFEYIKYLPRTMVLTLYCTHIYLELEIGLALWATPARAFLGFELEPHFNEPYLATSLQDFWGRRWNLMVTCILHSAVYNPIRRISTHIMGAKWASLPAVLGAFVVSGLMHELIYYYFTMVYPTWEVTWFFILHGVCVAIEVVVKKVIATDKFRLHPAFSVPLTVGFVVVTGFWLFFAQFVRYGIDEKQIKECLMFVNFVKEMLQSLMNYSMLFSRSSFVY
ncbi:hypothetical protein DITRI_Ditri01bG0188700 [Diplodiscus trichospermus]